MPTSGGGVASSDGTLTIQYSLIDDNSAFNGTFPDGGGGVQSLGVAGPAVLTVRDSTITGNSAGGLGGGILSRGRLDNVTTIQRVTIVGNSVTSDPSGGGVALNPAGQPFTVQGSIIAANSGDGAAATTTAPTACPSAAAATS